MNKNYTDSEVLPHKKPGKNKMKSSPNKHGCEKNNYQPHQFAVFTTVYAPQVKQWFNDYRTPQFDGFSSVSFFHMKQPLKEGFLIVRCVDCGKRARNNKPVFSEPIATIAYFGPDEGHWEVELNKSRTKLRKIAKMDW